MKITKEKTEIKLAGVNNQIQFKLEEKEIFKLLTSRLYSNPLRTMLQEYISNARDAHREAKQTKPIEIFFDEMGQIHIKDYGKGLSKKRLHEVFIYFGRSTKRSTNKQIGGFGIGAKSAFAYTDSFTIVNRYNGIKTTYIATIKDEVPILIELEKDESNDTGIEIIIPINPDDIDKAKQYVYELCLFWYDGIFNKFDKVDIKFPNRKWDNIHEYRNEMLKENNTEYAIVRFSDFYNTITVEGIPYTSTDIGSYGLVKHFKIGEIKLSNTRETFLNSEIDKIKNVYKQTIKKMLKEKKYDYLYDIYYESDEPIHVNKYVKFDENLYLKLRQIKNTFQQTEIVYDEKYEIKHTDPILIYDKKVTRSKIIKQLKYLRHKYNFKDYCVMSRDLYEDIKRTDPEILKFLRIIEVEILKEYPSTKEISLYGVYSGRTKVDKEYFEKVLKETIRILGHEFPKVIYVREKIVDSDVKVFSKLPQDIFFIKNSRIAKKYNLMTSDEFVSKLKEVVLDYLNKYKQQIEVYVILSQLKSFDTVKVKNIKELESNINKEVKENEILKLFTNIDTKYNQLLRSYSVSYTMELIEKYDELKSIPKLFRNMLKKIYKERYGIELEFCFDGG